METPTNYLRKADVLLDIQVNKPFIWADLDYGFIAVALGMGAGSSIIGNSLLKTAELLCIGGCSLYGEETRVMITGAFGIAGTIAAFGYCFFKDAQNILKEAEAQKILKQSTDIIANSDYEELIKIMGPNISPDLHKRFCIPTDNQVVAISRQESKNLAALLQQILDENDDPVDIYTVFESKKIPPYILLNYLCSKLSNDNVRKIYQFAKENEMMDLTKACTKYYKKNIAVINLENSIKKL